MIMYCTWTSSMYHCMSCAYISAEFSEFVRSAFEKMGVKMDNIVTGQQALEVKLDLVNQQVKSNKGDIEKLKKTADCAPHR